MTNEPGENVNLSFENLPPQDKFRTLRGFYLASITHHRSIPLISSLARKWQIPEKTVVAKLLKERGSEVNKMRDLLRTANITQAMKDHINHDFGQFFSRPSKQGALNEEFIKLPEWLNRNDAGIYSEDKEICKEIERIEYGKISKLIALLHTEDNESLPGSDPIYANLIGRWRQEFFQRYGDEPQGNSDE